MRSVRTLFKENLLKPLLILICSYKLDLIFKNRHELGDQISEKMSKKITKGKLKRIYVTIMGFYLFDYISTGLFCPNPDQEGMPIPRFFMKLTNSVLIGLTINIVFIAMFWSYFFFNLYPRWFNKFQNSQNEKIIGFLNSLIFYIPVVFTATDFYGATSWYWNSLLAFPVGAIMYLISLKFWIKPSEH